MDLLRIKERLDADANITPAEFQALAHIGNTKFYKDMRAGAIRVRRFGGRNMITAADAKDYLAGRPMRPDPDGAPAYIPTGSRNPTGKNGKKKAA
ncbi:hypothetical protein [Methylocystis echinoides]|uniref:hypothetical protein n=1 Tax=Methylocystis echinoides TaxID=29468 RepID=UPI0034332A92